MWGLTGTPALESSWTVHTMASLLRVFTAPESDLDARRFLDASVRSNSWNAASLSVTQRVHVISQTRNERVLYLAQKNQLHGEASVQHRRRLLALCTHFCGDGAGSAATDAGQEVTTRQSDSTVRVLGKKNIAYSSKKEFFHQNLHAFSDIRLPLHSYNSILCDSAKF